MMEFYSSWFGLLFGSLLLVIIVSLTLPKVRLFVPAKVLYKGSVTAYGWLHPLRYPFYLMIAGVVLSVLALMRPRIRQTKAGESGQGIDIVLALDVSRSMTAYDLPEGMNLKGAECALKSGKLESRIAIACTELEKFIKNRPDDRVGLIAFADHAYMVCPPTLDHGFLLGHMDALQTGDTLSEFTGIAAPLASAVRRLKTSVSPRRVVVLFTDGGNNIEAELSPLQVAELARQYGVTVYTIGIGGTSSVVRVAFSGGRQRLVKVYSDLNRELLSGIAETSGGHFFEAKNKAAFAKVMKTIDKMEKIHLEHAGSGNYKELYPPFLLSGLVLLLTARILKLTWLRRVP